MTKKLGKVQDIRPLYCGDVITKRNLEDLIQGSKVESSEYYSGAKFEIGGWPRGDQRDWSVTQDQGCHNLR